MADWPDLDTLKAVLDVSSNDFDERLEGALTAAISVVQADIGEEVESPDEQLAEAALLMAVYVAKAPSESSEQVTWQQRRSDMNYQRLLKGRRVRFGVA